jgi:SNF2 family DNA or RNA helicase
MGGGAAASSSSSSAPARVLLLTTRAGGVGINLTAASRVIFLDHDWNEQVMLQAEDRAHRMGQTRAVHVHRLLCAGSIVAHMAEVAEGKGALSEALLQRSERRGGKGGGGEGSVTDRAMRALVGDSTR